MFLNLRKPNSKTTGKVREHQEYPSSRPYRVSWPGIVGDITFFWAIMVGLLLASPLLAPLAEQAIAAVGHPAPKFDPYSLLLEWLIWYAIGATILCQFAFLKSLQFGRYLSFYNGVRLVIVGPLNSVCERKRPYFGRLRFPLASVPVHRVTISGTVSVLISTAIVLVMCIILLVLSSLAIRLNSGFLPTALHFPEQGLYLREFMILFGSIVALVICGSHVIPYRRVRPNSAVSLRVRTAMSNRRFRRETDPQRVAGQHFHLIATRSERRGSWLRVGRGR